MSYALLDGSARSGAAAWPNRAGGRFGLLAGLLLVAPTCPGIAAAQSGPRLTAQEPVDTARVYTSAEQMPQPPGGMDGLMRYLAKNYRYPNINPRPPGGVAGKIIVRFIVRPDGRLSDVQVTQSLGAGFDEEALRVVRKMPPWTPGRQNGQPVKVWYSLPISIHAN